MTEESKKALQSDEWQAVRNIIKHEAVKEYLATSYEDAEKQCEIAANNVKYKVLRRDKKTTFYDESGNTLFDVDNEMLAAEYEKLSENQTDPETSMGKTIASIEKQAFDYAVQAEVKKENDSEAECIKGKSPSGTCGAAAYCDKGLKCCAECQEPCNSHCGWLDKPDNATEKTYGNEVEKENDSTEKTADTAEGGKLKEDKDKTEQSIPVYSGVDEAIAKLQAELEKAKEKEFAKPVIEYLLERCRQSESLAADICQSHKTWEKCYKYIYEEARKKLNSKSGPVRDDVVYEWAEDPRIERKKNMAKDWLEYLEWCKKLKYDLNNMFFYMPKNFKKVHDRTAKEYQALLNKKAAAEKKRQEALAKKRMEQMQKAMEEIFKKNAEADAFSIKGKGLILVVPKNGDEIRAEGEALNHCVGGYVGRVARGETNIFFVRKEDAPNKPYFTLEYNNNHVVQCRGDHNCDMPPDVKAFVKVFEKKMQDAVQKQNKARKHRKAG